MVAIMGPSGSGKSTLMHLLGLLHGPDRNGGPPPEVLVDGRSVANLSDRERTRLRASTMGFVFQAFNLVPTLTALENVALAAEYAGHEARAGERARARGARHGSASPSAPTIGRWSSPAASSSALRSRAAW